VNLWDRLFVWFVNPDSLWRDWLREWGWWAFLGFLTVALVLTA